MRITMIIMEINWKKITPFSRQMRITRNRLQLHLLASIINSLKSLATSTCLMKKKLTQKMKWWLVKITISKSIVYLLRVRLNDLLIRQNHQGQRLSKSKKLPQQHLIKIKNLILTALANTKEAILRPRKKARQPLREKSPMPQKEKLRTSLLQTLLWLLLSLPFAFQTTTM